MPFDGNLSRLLRPAGSIPQGMPRFDPNDPINEDCIGRYLLGTSTFDLSDYNSPGTWVNPPAFCPTPRGNGVLCNPSENTTLGTFQYFLVKNAPLVAALPNSTAVAVFLTTANTSIVGGSPLYAERASSGNDIWKLDFDDGMRPGDVFFTWRNDSGTLFQSSGVPVADGRLHVFIIITSGSTAAGYVDSVAPWFTTTLSAKSFTDAIQSRIANEPFSATFPGVIFQVALFSRAWNTGDISRFLTDNYAGLIFPSDRLPLWAPSGGAPILYYDMKIGAEIIGAAKADGPLAGETLATLPADLSMGAELLRGINADGRISAELLTALRIDGATTAETIGTAEAHGSIGSEAIGSGSANAASAAEMLSGATVNAALGAESLARIVADGSPASEVLSGILSSAWLNAETLGSAASNAALAAEVVSSVVVIVANGALGAEVIGTPRADAHMAGEVLGALRADARLDSEALAGIIADARLAAEKLCRLVADALPAAEALAGISAQGATAAELLQLVNVFFADAALAAELRVAIQHLLLSAGALTTSTLKGGAMLTSILTPGRLE